MAGRVRRACGRRTRPAAAPGETEHLPFFEDDSASETFYVTGAWRCEEEEEESEDSDEEIDPAAMQSGKFYLTPNVNGHPQRDEILLCAAFQSAPGDYVCYTLSAAPALSLGWHRVAIGGTPYETPLVNGVGINRSVPLGPTG